MESRILWTGRIRAPGGITMTSMELLKILNAIRDSYILEARAMGSEKKPKMMPPGSGSPAEKPLPVLSEKALGRYQAKESRKRKKNGMKNFLVLAAAAGLLLAVLAGRGTIAGWADYFETFLNRTENPYQYTQPTETTQAYTETTAAQPETTAANAETRTTQAEPNDLEAAQENLLSVLAGERTFFDRGNEISVTIEEYCADGEEVPGVNSVKITKYTSADLDQDEVPEIILWILVNEYSDYGTLVLRFQDNQVEGYTFWYRQLFELKQDGTFSTSGDEAGRVKSLTFDEEGWHYVDIDIADQQQDLKEGVVWFDYPGEDYSNLFSPF